jgi:hypothetical protein
MCAVWRTDHAGAARFEAHVRAAPFGGGCVAVVISNNSVSRIMPDR